LLNKSIKDLAQPNSRQRRNFMVIETGVLEAWAAQHNLSLREAYQQALANGIFPENLERNFPTFSGREQLRLFNSTVLVAGLGGLGGYQAQLLARVGVGRLVLADGDCFAATNFNRQPLATKDTLGRAKAGATADFINRINPALEVQAVKKYLDPGNYPVILAKVDLVLDALDSFGDRRELLMAARKAGTPVIHGAVLGQNGQITTILPEDEPIFASSYLNQPSHFAEPPSVVAPSVSLVASLQVQEAIRLLLNLPLAYHGILAYLDGDIGRPEFFPLW
jgi:molybdopterin-synthase adenylyltransferase